MPDSRVRETVELMAGFAERTGLSSERPQQRYLWTDAFAVCNFLSLSHDRGQAIHGVRIRLRELMQYVPVGERIESFWRAPHIESP